MDSIGFLIQVILLVSLPLIKCKASNASQSTPGLGTDEDSSSSDCFRSPNGNPQMIGRINFGLQNLSQGARASTSQSVLSGYSAPGAQAVDEGGGNAFPDAASNLPHLEALHQESDSEEEDVKPDVETLQSQLQSFQQRLDRRRLQNRLAARRSRQRRKDQADYLTKKTQKLNSANTDLKYEIENLTAEKEELKRQLEEHLKVCQNSHLLSSAQTVESYTPVVQYPLTSAGPANASASVSTAAMGAAGASHQGHSISLTPPNYAQMQQQGSVSQGAVPFPVASQTSTQGTPAVESIPQPTLSSLLDCANVATSQVQEHLISPQAPQLQGDPSAANFNVNLSHQQQQPAENTLTISLLGTPNTQPNAPIVFAPQTPTTPSVNLLPLVLSDFEDNVPHTSHNS